MPTIASLMPATRHERPVLARRPVGPLNTLCGRYLASNAVLQVRAWLVTLVRRRAQILRLFSHCNWVEMRPIRAPRPLKDGERMLNDLWNVSIERKVAGERAHVSVRAMLNRRRVLREFTCALAAAAQERVAVGEVGKLIRRRTAVRRTGTGIDGQRASAQSRPCVITPMDEAATIGAGVHAWHRSFFRVRADQRTTAVEVLAPERVFVTRPRADSEPTARPSGLRSWSLPARWCRTSGSQGRVRSGYRNDRHQRWPFSVSQMAVRAPRLAHVSDRYGRTIAVFDATTP